MTTEVIKKMKDKWLEKITALLGALYCIATTNPNPESVPKKNLLEQLDDFSKKIIGWVNTGDSRVYLRAPLVILGMMGICIILLIVTKGCFLLFLMVVALLLLRSNTK